MLDNPNVETAVIVFMGACFGLGMFLAACAIRNVYLDKRDLPVNIRKRDDEAKPTVDPKRLGVAIVVGLLVAVLLGWPIVALVVAAGTYAAPAMFARTGLKDFGERTDAVAV